MMAEILTQTANRPRRSNRLGAFAALTSVALGGFGGAKASAQQIPALSTEISHTALELPQADLSVKKNTTIDYKCPAQDSRCYPEWKLIDVHPVTGNMYGPKHTCVSYENNSNYSGEVECSLANMSSETTSVVATVVGSFPVGILAVQDSVSYSLTESQTMTGSYTLDTPAKTEGSIQVAPEYDNITMFVQQESWCDLREEGSVDCHPKTNFAIGVTAEYSNPSFSAVIDKIN